MVFDSFHLIRFSFLIQLYQSIGNKFWRTDDRLQKNRDSLLSMMIVDGKL